MMKLCLSILVLLNALWAYGTDVHGFTDVRQQFLKDFVKGEKWLKNEPESMWCYEVVFFDFNGDGCEEALACDQLDRETGACSWSFVCRTARGDIVSSGRADDDVSIKAKSGEISFGCPARCLYKVVFDNMERLIGRDVGLYEYVPTSEGKERQLYSSQTILLSMPQGTQLVAAKLPNGIDDVVVNPGFRRLEHAHCEVYAGFDMKRLCPDQRCSVSDKENLLNGGLVAPVGFKSFAERYREDVKRRLGLTRPVTVYAVFFDADLDGDADCYVSSDAESAGAGRYRWTLFLNDAHEMRKAKERVWRDRGTIKDVAMLEPEDVAGKDSFYRVVRTHGSAQILVMESDGKRLHTHAYTHLLSEEDRRKCPPRNRYQLKAGQQSFDDWEGEMRDKYGFMPPMDFRDQVAWLFFHHLERLPCISFPEKD